MTVSPGEGWHPDPDGIHQLRYHDGSGWTVHVANNGAVTQAPRSAPPPPPPPSAAMSAPPSGSAQLEDDMEWIQHLALEYSTRCTAVFDALEAALQVANDANNARNMANMRPQHEISIRNFTNRANDLEQKFVPLYQAFQAAAAEAREAGIRLAESSGQFDPETSLLTSLDPEAYSEVSAAVEYLRASYGPTPQAFLAGIGAANQIIKTSPDFGEPGFRGSIYTESRPGGANAL